MGISSIEEPDSSGFCGYCNVCTNFHKINRSLRTSFHCIRQKNCLLLTEDFIKKTSHIPNYFIRCNNTVLNNFKSKNGCQFLYFSSVSFNSRTLLKIQYRVTKQKNIRERENCMKYNWGMKYKVKKYAKHFNRLYDKQNANEVENKQSVIHLSWKAKKLDVAPTGLPWTRIFSQCFLEKIVDPRVHGPKTHTSPLWKWKRGLATCDADTTNDRTLWDLSN